MALGTDVEDTTNLQEHTDKNANSEQTACETEIILKKGYSSLFIT